MNLFVEQLAEPWDSGTLSEKPNALNYLETLNPKPCRNNGGETGGILQYFLLKHL